MTGRVNTLAWPYSLINSF